MLHILMTKPSNDVKAFWRIIDPVETNTLINLYVKGTDQSWTYNGTDVITLPEMPVSEVLEFMQLHKLFKNVTDSFHNVHLHIYNDWVGVVTNTLKPYKVTFIDDVQQNYFKPLELTYTIKEEELINKVVLLCDRVDMLYEMDEYINASFEEAYLLTRRTDMMTLVAVDYLLKTLAFTVDASYHYITQNLITCEPYTLLKVKKVLL